MKRMIGLVMCLLMVLCLAPTAAMATTYSDDYFDIVVGAFFYHEPQEGWGFASDSKWHKVIATDSSYEDASFTTFDNRLFFDDNGKGTITNCDTNYLEASYTDAGLMITMCSASLTNKIKITPNATATIIVSGTNSIYTNDNDASGITHNGCLDIQGNGKLSITVFETRDGNSAFGIYSQSLFISNNPTLNILARASESNASGIIVDNKLFINGGTFDITAISGGGYARGLSFDWVGSINNLTSATIMASGTNDDSGAIYFPVDEDYPRILTVATPLTLKAGDNTTPMQNADRDPTTGVVSQTSVLKKYVTIASKSEEPNPVEPTEYSISIVTPTNGKVTVSPTSAASGTSVTITATPNSGYELNSLTYSVVGGTPVAIKDGTFIMPEGDVTINATFKAVRNVTDGSGEYVPSSKKVESGKTDDAGVLLYAGLAFSSILGLSYTVTNRKSYLK